MNKYTFEVYESNTGSLTVEAVNEEQAEVEAMASLIEGLYSIDDRLSNVELGRLIATKRP